MYAARRILLLAAFLVLAGCTAPPHVQTAPAAALACGAAKAIVGPPDVIVFGPKDGETGPAFEARVLATIQTLPANCRAVEFFATCYVGGDGPMASERYAWRWPETMARLRDAVWASGRVPLVYASPSRMTTAGIDGQEMLAELLRPIADGWGGWHLDGVPLTGRETPGSALFLTALRSKARQYEREPFLLLHADGHRSPGTVEALADVVLVGEFGTGTVPWGTRQPLSWVTGDWRHLNRLDHPQWHTYASKIARLRPVDGRQVWMAYKMDSEHVGGRAVGYPADWPTYGQWVDLLACHGALRTWLVADLSRAAEVRGAWK